MTERASIAMPLSHYPGMSPFVLDWLGGSEPATRFLPRNPRFSAGASRRYPVSAPLVTALIESNRRYGLFVKDTVHRWAAGESVTLVGGQQVGFAGGPLYTLAKIASLVKMKRVIERSGTPATVFFWLATEDHDFEEVAQLAVPVSTLHTRVNRELDLLTIRSARAFESRQVVGPMPVPPELIAELLAVYAMPRPEWLREGVTFGESFAELVASVFGAEVVLVDALLPELRRAGKPLFDLILADWGGVEEAVVSRSAELARAGYRPQVAARDGERYSLLFELRDDGTRRLIDDPSVSVPDAERISTSALTRPLFQDFVLRPDIFVGGPAEVSYYAQIAPLHELLGVALPRVALRGHALLAPARVMRHIETHGIRPEQVFTSADEILAEREPEAVAEVKRIATAARRDLATRLEQIGEIALPAEHALARAINHSIGHIEYHFEKLTERAIRGLARKERDRYAAVREVVATLYPDRHVQDRVVSWFSYWCRYGQQVVERMVTEIEPDTASCRIVSL